MLFNVQNDEGSRIVGYLVPDGFSGSCSLRISDGQKDLAVLLCDQELPAIAAAGRHATGRCGFIIDETIVPELAQKEALELYDQETNLTHLPSSIAAQVTHQRIFRLETHLFPLGGSTIGPNRTFSISIRASSGTAARPRSKCSCCTMRHRSISADG